MRKNDEIAGGELHGSVPIELDHAAPLDDDMERGAVEASFLEPPRRVQLEDAKHRALEPEIPQNIAEEVHYPDDRRSFTPSQACPVRAARATNEQPKKEITMAAEQGRKGALVTGGGSGIGFAIATELLARGYDVAICGRDPAKLSSAKKVFPRLIAMEADVANPEDHRKLASWLSEKLPHINVLVNNAGIQQALDFRSHVAAEVIRREIDINLFGPIALSAIVLPMLLRNAHPSVINVTSALAFCPMAGTPVYCATKAALHSFTVSLRHQLQGRARVVELAPPIVETELGSAHRRPGEGRPPVISAQAFASEALARFEIGEDEIAVGLANTLRQRGEAMFSDLNRS